MLLNGACPKGHEQMVVALFQSAESNEQTLMIEMLKCFLLYSLALEEKKANHEKGGSIFQQHRFISRYNYSFDSARHHSSAL